MHSKPVQAGFGLMMIDHNGSKLHTELVPTDLALDEAVRLAAMAFLRAEALHTGGPVSSIRLREFTYEGQRIPLVNQTGIWKPAFLDAALTIRTKFEPDLSKRPYHDEPGADGLMRYKWRGTDGNISDNRALRTAMQRSSPLIYLVGIAKGLYEPIFPVFLVDEEPSQHQFVLALTEEERGFAGASLPVVDLRKYAERVRKERLHQPVFRSQVLHAYKSRCSLCHLGHVELIDAAHIQSDAENGQPVVTNGIAMCNLHHATFDNRIVGIDADYRIHIREDILSEVDGPTLQHSIKALHGNKITLPSQRTAHPDRSLLDARFEQFSKAG